MINSEIRYKSIKKNANLAIELCLKLYMRIDLQHLFSLKTESVLAMLTFYTVGDGTIA